MLPQDGVDPTIAALLRYLAERTGLIISRGRVADSSGVKQEHYSFLHLSIQEFMAARWLVERMTDDDWLDREKSREDMTFNSDLPADALPTLRKRCGQAEWHEVFFLLHELWQKPTPLFRLFSANPWDNITNPNAIERLHNGVCASHSLQEEQLKSIYMLLIAVALDESNGLAMHRSFRYELLKALHQNAGLCWQFDTFKIAASLLRKGGLFELSKDALKSVLKENLLSSLSLPNSICESLSILDEVLKEATNLTSLGLHSCIDLNSLDVIDRNKLRVLWLHSCQASNLSPLQYFKHLDVLSVGSYEYSDIKILGNLTSLTSLFLLDCVFITDLRALQNLENLRWLSLIFCSGVKDINPIAKLNNLEKLDLAECSAVNDLEPLKKLRKLRNLDISGCSGLRDPKRQIAGLKEALPKLKIIFDS